MELLACGKKHLCLDLVVVVITSTSLLFVLVCFYFANNNVCLSPKNICTWVINMDFASWVSVLVFLCEEQ